MGKIQCPQQIWFSSYDTQCNSKWYYVERKMTIIIHDNDFFSSSFHKHTSDHISNLHLIIFIICQTANLTGNNDTIWLDIFEALKISWVGLKITSNCFCDCDPLAEPDSVASRHMHNNCVHQDHTLVFCDLIHEDLSLKNYQLMVVGSNYSHNHLLCQHFFLQSQVVCSI